MCCHFSVRDQSLQSIILYRFIKNMAFGVITLHIYYFFLLNYRESTSNLYTYTCFLNTLFIQYSQLKVIKYSRFKLHKYIFFVENIHTVINTKTAYHLLITIIHQK